MKTASLLIPKRSIFLSLCLFLSTHWVWAQWSKKCVEGGSVNCFVANGADLFAGTFVGVYRSSDDGETWQLSSSGIAIADVRSMLVTSSKLFAGSGGGIYASSDGGSNWSLCGLPNQRIYTLIESQGTLFAGSSYGGIYQSNDDGATWEYLALIEYDIRSLTVSGNTLIAGVVGPYSIFYSTDNGLTWEQSTAPYSNVVSFAATGSDILAASTEGIIKSSNNGVSWNLSSSGMDFLPTETIYNHDGNLYAGSYGSGIFFSNNNGANWTPINNGLSNRYVLGIFGDESKVFIGTFGGGIYTSTTNGAMWSQSNNGYCSQAIVDFGLIGSALIAATPNGVYKSIDEGETWVESSNGLSNASGNVPNIFSLATDGSTAYAGTQSQGIYKSIDNGENWTAINNGFLDGEHDVISIAASGSTLFAGTYGLGIFRSTNGGNSWVQTISGLAHQVVESISFMGSDVFCSHWNGISKSTDNGNSWISINNIASGAYDLVVVGNILYAGGAGSVGVIKSTDGGETWVSVNNGLSDLNIQSLVANENALVAGTNSGAFISTNEGATWTLLNDGFANPAPGIQSLIIKNNDLFAGTLYQSVWKRSDLEIDVSSLNELNDKTSTAISLKQNTPNPVQDNTTIRFELAESGHVSLKVYDLLGTEVACLADGLKPAGVHALEFNTNNLAAGVYLYTLVSGNLRVAKRMNVMK